MYNVIIYKILYRYSDLLALAEELEQKPQKRGKNSKAKTKSINIQDSETESEDSEVRLAFNTLEKV